MGQAAGENKRGKRPEEPAEANIRPFRYEDHKGERNGKVRKCDDGIGDYVNDQDLRIPQQAKPMRRKHGRIKEFFDAFQHLLPR